MALALGLLAAGLGWLLSTDQLLTRSAFFAIQICALILLVRVVFASPGLGASYTSLGWAYALIVDVAFVGVVASLVLS
jgi:hypothetical protein